MSLKSLKQDAKGRGFGGGERSKILYSGPSHVVKTGKTPVLDAAEARQLLANIHTETPEDLGDRALLRS